MPRGSTSSLSAPPRPGGTRPASSSVLTQEDHPPEDLCALLPAAPPPRPRPGPGPSTCWALLAVWTLCAARSATGASPQGRGPWRWPRTAGRASGPLPARWSLNTWMGRIPGDVGSRGRAACCPSAPDRPQGTCLQGGLLSTPPPVTSTPLHNPRQHPTLPSLRCVSCPPARLLKELCPEMTAVILSRVSGSAAACAEPGVWGLRTSSRRGSLRRAPARLRPAESSKEGRHAMWT